MKKYIKLVKSFFSKNKTTILFLLLIVGIALAVRLVLLDKIPTGMSDDEILFPLSARSFFYTGKDLTEQWSPLSLSKPPANIIQVFGKVPFMLFSPYFANVNLSMFSARFPYALFGGLFVLVIFLICKKLFSTKVALIISLVMALNPWAIFFSRTAYEAPIATYFAFSMFAALLYFKSWKILLAFPLYILSFFSYIGTPVVLPLFTVLLVLYNWLANNRKSTRYYIIFLVLAFATLILYTIHLPNDVGGNRVSQILSPNSPAIVSEVNWNRKESISTPFSGFFINKYENSIKTFISQYFEAFSPVYLFSNGEGSARFTVWSHGEFYLVDLLFLIFGFIALINHKKKQVLLLLALLLVSPIPSAVSLGDAQYALRSAFMFPILVIFIGYGIYSFINRFKNKLMPGLIVVFVYVILVANFGYIYIFRNPIYNYDSFGISGRVLSRYIALSNQHGYKIQVLANGTNKGLFKQYLFFNNKYTQANHSLIAADFLKPKINIDNVTFADCKDINLDKSEITVIPFNLKCTSEKISLNRLDLTDYTNNQPIYQIYNDQLCKRYSILPYLNNFSLSDFNIEKLNEQEFCQTFFTRTLGLNSINSTGSAVPADQ
jgi:4-amino-4-deoxy-L-arabinose transferase-like glycosyltransferase